MLCASPASLKRHSSGYSCASTAPSKHRTILAQIKIDEMNAKSALLEIAEAKILVPNMTLDVLDRAMQDTPVGSDVGALRIVDWPSLKAAKSYTYLLTAKAINLTLNEPLIYV